MLPEWAFGAVHSRNGLRLFTKPYWRQSLRRFRELLAPGGLPVMENVNAIGIHNEVDELLAECDLVPLPEGAGREPNRRYVLGLWPTG